MLINLPHIDRITAMNRRAKALKHQGQAIGHTIATDMTLINLNLMQNRLNHFIINRMIGNVS